MYGTQPRPEFHERAIRTQKWPTRWRQMASQDARETLKWKIQKDGHSDVRAGAFPVLL